MTGVGLARASLGVVPIVWNNADLRDLAPEVPATTVLDEIARIGFDGCQFGRGFPDGDALRDALAQRNLRLAEWYCAIPNTPDGLDTDAAVVAHTTLERLASAGGEVLVVALESHPLRDASAGRVGDDTPRWPRHAIADLARLLSSLAEAAAGGGGRVAFHPHAATWIEAPHEVTALAEELVGTGAGLCLDVGHYLVGGGDPVEALERYGELVTHVHAKDVDAAVLAGLRAGRLERFDDAIRARIFTELGNGLLDVDGVVAALARRDYDGWVMVEQDSTWLAPSEAALVGRRILSYAYRRVSTLDAAA